MNCASIGAPCLTAAKIRTEGGTVIGTPVNGGAAAVNGIRAPLLTLLVERRRLGGDSFRCGPPRRRRSIRRRHREKALSSPDLGDDYRQVVVLGRAVPEALDVA